MFQQDQAHQSKFEAIKMEVEQKDEKENCFIATKSKFYNENQFNQNISQCLGKPPPQIKLQSSTIPRKGDNPKTNKKNLKKPKILIDNFQQFLPQLLLQINHERPKPIIRIGSNYQAKVPLQPIYKTKHRDLSHLQVWSGSSGQKGERKTQSDRFDTHALQKFREMIGQFRTEEQLCHLKLQFQCSWDRLIGQIAKRKVQLKKYYSQKDKTKN